MEQRSRRQIGVRPIATDSGWGWLVVFGSFAIHVFCDGIVYSFGVMVVELLDYFDDGRSLTSWIASILVGVTLGIGPLASAATSRFGCRATTIFGALVATAGCLLSFFARTVWHLCISVGLVMGTGFGLMYCSAIVIVTLYFERRRALATGIAVCGAGVGTFIFSPLTSFLIAQYTWRGAFLIYAGIVLNCTAFGALFRPLDVEPIYADDDDVTMPLNVGQNGINGVVDGAHNLTSLHSLEAISEDTVTEDPKDGKVQLLHPQVRHLRGESDPMRRQRAQSHSHVNGRNRDPILFTSAPRLADSPSMHRGNRELSDSNAFLGVREVFYASHLDLRASLASMHYQQPVALSAQPGAPLRTSLFSDTAKLMKEMVDVSLLKNPAFLMFAISNFLTSIGFNAPLIFLPDRAVYQLGIRRRHASLLLSAYGVTNTMGRVLVGSLSDRPLACRWGRSPPRNRLWTYNVSITLCGLATLFSSLCRDFTTLLVYSATLGFTLSCYICLTTVLLVDLLGVDKMTRAFGLVLLLEGIASLVGPPLAGWIIDTTGNYDYAFYFAGISIAISGLMLFPLPWMQARQLRQTTRKEVPLTYTPCPT